MNEGLKGLCYPLRRSQRTGWDLKLSKLEGVWSPAKLGQNVNTRGLLRVRGRKWM
jgi:hypothetical protein